MEEIENRFQIIRIAVDLSDYQVVDLQIKHLRNLSTDDRLHAILDDLESKNFRQALYQMRHYSASLKDDFFTSNLHDQQSVSEPEPKPEPKIQPTAVEKQTSVPEPSTAQTNLFAPHEVSTGERVIGLEEMQQMTKESATKPRRYTDEGKISNNYEKVPQLQNERQEVFLEKEEAVIQQDPLFTLDQDAGDDTIYSHPAPTKNLEPEEKVDKPKEEILSFAEIKETPLFTEDILEEEMLDPTPRIIEEASLEAHHEEEKIDYEPKGMFSLDTADEAEETLFDTEAHLAITENEEAAPEVKNVIPEPATRSTSTEETSAEREYLTKQEQEPVFDHSTEEDDNELADEPLSLRRWDSEPDEDDILYAKFAFMGQKFRNMMHQYPQCEVLDNGISEEVQQFIHLVSTHDYTESQVEAAIDRYQKLKEMGRIAEAAQMLIAAATTESVYAQFMLARELFRGGVLQQNYPEAFTQINHLAEEDYPEAICDLGQLYEYGIGIDKNKRHALLLYEEAAEMGVERARNHYDRLKSTNPLQSIKSITSSFLKRRKK